MKKILKSVRGSIHYEKSTNISDTILLAGCARGGTTWVSNIINHDNSYRYIFEPFNPKYVNQFKGFKYRQYIRYDEIDKHLYDATKKILQGQVRNLWIDRFNRKIASDRRLIKDVRVNLLLKWIKTNFPELKIVLLLRHPFAVAQSRRVLNWKTYLSMFYNQAKLVDDYLQPFISYRGIENDFERHVLGWCIENYVPLKQFDDSDDIYIAHYEKFCRGPIEETIKLLNWLGNTDFEVTERVIRQPSEMAKSHSAIMSGENLISKWKKFVTEDEIERGMEIIQSFGLEKVYNRDPMPIQ